MSSSQLVRWGSPETNAFLQKRSHKIEAGKLYKQPFGLSSVNLQNIVA